MRALSPSASFGGLLGLALGFLVACACSSTSETRLRDAPDSGASGSSGQPGDASGGSANRDGFGENCQPDAPNAWPLDWQFCRPVAVTGSASTPYTSRLVISATYFADNSAQPDLDDLRFFEGSCAKPGAELPYWIDSETSGPDHVVWVRSESPNPDEIAMYYGNPAATRRADANRTFDLLDAFESTALDSNIWTTQLWKTNCARNTASVAGGRLILDVASTAVGDKGCDFFVMSKAKFLCGTVGTLVEFRGVTQPYWRGGTQPTGIYRRADQGLGDGPAGTSGDSVAIVADEFGVYLSRCLSGACSPHTDSGIDVASPVDLSIACTNGKVTWFANGQSPYTLTGGAPSADLRVYLHVGSWDQYVQGSRTEVSEIRARRYTEPEPALSIGAQQTRSSMCP